MNTPARLAYAAAHVATQRDYRSDPSRAIAPGDIDWDRTLAFRRYLWSLGLGVAGVTVSPLPGPAGNVEYFLWLRRDAPPVDPAAVAEVTGQGTPEGDR